MQKLPFLLLAGLALLTSRAQAQTTFSIGPRVGLNLATCHFTEPAADFTPKYRAGFEAGVASSVSRGHFALQAALLYSQKGYQDHTTVEIRTGNGSYSTGELEHAERLNYLTLPLSLAYTLRRDGQGFQVFGGAYVGVFLNGHYDNITTPQSGPVVTQTVEFNVRPDVFYDYGPFVQRYDAGFQGGLGYRYQGLLFQAGYNLGLRNVSAETFLPYRPDRANRAFQVSLSYLLGSKE